MHFPREFGTQLVHSFPSFLHGHLVIAHVARPLQGQQGDDLLDFIVDSGFELKSEGFGSQ